MSIFGHGLLATLRERRRRIAAAIVPALLASLLTGAACPAMSATPAASHMPAAPLAQHHHPAAHDHHSHHDAAPSPVPPAGDCPHCAGGHLAANVGDDCGVAATTTLAPTHALSAAALWWPPSSHEPTAASTAPPLIRARSQHRAPFASSVPLHIRHCALLI